jgi:hypothetical protein
MAMHAKEGQSLANQQDQIPKSIELIMGLQE